MPIRFPSKALQRVVEGRGRDFKPVRAPRRRCALLGDLIEIGFVGRGFVGGCGYRSLTEPGLI